MWTVNHFRVYLYGHDVIVYSDHSAVKAVLETPNPSGKHARWWLKVFGSGINIVYKAGKENTSADALSCNPHGQVPQGVEVEQIQVASVQSEDLTLSELLQLDPVPKSPFELDFGAEQHKDPELCLMFNFLIHDKLPTVEQKAQQKARKLAAQALHFSVIENILYFVESKQDGRKRCAVPEHLRQQIMTESHSSPMAGHFSGEKLYKSLARHWWWPGMYTAPVL